MQTCGAMYERAASLAQMNALRLSFLVRLVAVFSGWAVSGRQQCQCRDVCSDQVCRPTPQPQGPVPAGHCAAIRVRGAALYWRM
jgi:hypothetical protein